MKKCRIAVIICMIFLIAVSAFSVYAVDGFEDLEVKNQNKSVTGITETNESKNLKRQHETIDYVCKTIPEDIFGGVYLDENQNIIVNITEENKELIECVQSRFNGEKIIFKKVELSLAYLEEVHAKLNNYMKEYNIAGIDANEVTNKIDIELYKDMPEIYDFLADFISIKHVNISVIPEGRKYSFCVKKCDDSKEEKTLSAESSQMAATMVLYPGLTINKDGYEYTVGPKYSATTFKTSGHASRYGSGTSFYMTVSGIRRKVGTTQSYSLGFGGDHMTVSVNSMYFSLPSTNRFAAGSGTYSITSTHPTGTNIEMHGGKSGVSQGKITGTNQSVYIQDLGITIFNLGRASYTSQGGDSGAGVFSANAINVTGYCYGIQSIGVFDNNSQISTYSYFSYI